MNKKIVKVVRFVCKIPFMLRIKNALLPYWNHLEENYINKNVRKYGIGVLADFDTVMNKNNIHYAVFAGTLLGAIREKGLLKHDMDIDTMMFNKNYSENTQKLLEKEGFKLIRQFLVEDGKVAREETYAKKGVHIDIYYIYSDERFPTYQCDFYQADGAKNNGESMEKFGYVRVRRLEFPVSEKVRRVDFENIKVNVPFNAEEWLEYRYGKNYMIPDPNFKDKGDNPNIIDWVEYKGVLLQF